MPSPAIPKGGTLTLRKQRYGIALQWDRSSSTMDLDLQAVVVDSSGSIVDAVYYNQLEACDRALLHTGDEKTGAADGFDETIWVNMAKIRKEIKMVIFVIAAHSGGTLGTVDEASVHVVERWQGNEQGHFQLEKVLGGVLPILVMTRDASGDEWALTRLSHSGEDGNHFMDILEPELGNIIRARIKDAPKVQKLNFHMTKGSKVDLPSAQRLKQVNIGVGWDMGQKNAKNGKAHSVDLDVSAVLFSEEAKLVGAVFYNNTRQWGCTHTGDNTTGAGAGDDEVIQVDLRRIPESVTQIFFVVNIYTKGVTFEKLANASCRVSESSGRELLKYNLDDSMAGDIDGQGLIIARLTCDAKTKRWGFQGMGIFCEGRRWMDAKCLQELKGLYYKGPAEIRETKRKKARNSKRSESPVKKQVSTNAQEFRRNLAAGMFQSQHSAQSSGELPVQQEDSKEDSSTMQHVFVGVGWDLARSNMQADLDVSAVFFHRDGRDLGAVDCENVVDFGVEHSGDNRTGEGDGDDEVILVDLLAIPAEVSQIFFLVNMYTKSMSFHMVENAYCRMVNCSSGAELVRSELSTKGRDATGLIIAQLFRHPVKGWCFKARRRFCDGRTWLDPNCMKEMKELYQQTLQEVDPAVKTAATPQPLAARQVGRLWRGKTYEQALGVLSPRSSEAESPQAPDEAPDSPPDSPSSPRAPEEAWAPLLPARVVVSL